MSAALCAKVAASSSREVEAADDGNGGERVLGKRARAGVVPAGAGGEDAS